jgi:hypothetical protein
MRSMLYQADYLRFTVCACYSWNLLLDVGLDASFIILQTEEHVFWDCKRYEEQQATLRGILSENNKKEYPKSVAELLRLEEKDFCKASVHKLHSYIYFKIDTYEKKRREMYKILILYSQI